MENQFNLFRENSLQERYRIGFVGIGTNKAESAAEKLSGLSHLVDDILVLGKNASLEDIVEHSEIAVVSIASERLNPIEQYEKNKQKIMNIALAFTNYKGLVIVDAKPVCYCSELFKSVANLGKGQVIGYDFDSIQSFRKAVDDSNAFIIGDNDIYPIPISRKSESHNIKALKKAQHEKSDQMHIFLSDLIEGRKTYAATEYINGFYLLPVIVKNLRAIKAEPDMFNLHDNERLKFLVSKSSRIYYNIRNMEELDEETIMQIQRDFPEKYNESFIEKKIEKIKDSSLYNNVRKYAALTMTSIATGLLLGVVAWHAISLYSRYAEIKKPSQREYAVQNTKTYTKQNEEDKLKITENSRGISEQQLNSTAQNLKQRLETKKEIKKDNTKNSNHGYAVQNTKVYTKQNEEDKIKNNQNNKNIMPKPKSQAAIIPADEFYNIFSRSVTTDEKNYEVIFTIIDPYMQIDKRNFYINIIKQANAIIRGIDYKVSNAEALVKEFEKNYELNPNGASAAFLAIMYGKLRNYDLMMDYLLKYTQREDFGYYMDNDFYPIFKAVLKELINKNPDNPKAYYTLASLMHEYGEDASELFVKVMGIRGK